MSNVALDNFNLLLPDTVSFNVYRGEGERSPSNGAFSGLPSYFNANVSDTTGYLPATPDAWCVDTDTFIISYTPYTANVYSTYETIPSTVLAPLNLNTALLSVDANEDGYVDRLQALNWLFNFVIEPLNAYGPTGSPLNSGYEYDIIGDSTKEVFSVATMQIAIWRLLNQPHNTSTSDDYFGLIGTPDVALADQLVTYVTTGGRQNFVPTAGQTVAVILASITGEQPIVIEVPVPQPPPIIVPPTFEKYVDGVCICGSGAGEYVAGYGYLADGGTGPKILAGQAVTWTYVVTGSGNPQAEALSISLTDDNGTPFNNTDNFTPTLVSGDTDLDGKLDFNETWVYKATGTAIFDPAAVDPATGFSQFTNTAKLTYASNFTPLEDTATYNSYKADIKLDKVTSDGVNTGDGIEVLTGAAITWTYTVTNLGTSTIALNDIKIVDDNGTVAVSDDLSTTSGGITAQIGVPGYNIGDINSNSLLDVGEAWVYTASGTAQQGTYTNNATVTANPNGLCSTGACITASDVSSYTGITPVTGIGSRTPGFWQNKNWQKFWDGIAGNEPKQAGTSGFPPGELLYAVSGQTTTGLLVGDFNKDGLTNNGESTIFINRAEAFRLIQSKEHAAGNKRDDLGRSTVATWLNYLAGNPIDLIGGGYDVRDAITDSVQWLTQTASQNIAASSSPWQNGFSSSNPLLATPSGSFLNGVLDGYNNGSAQYATGNFHGGI